MKNTFGTSVYSKQYTFPILFVKCYTSVTNKNKHFGEEPNICHVPINHFLTYKYEAYSLLNLHTLSLYILPLRRDHQTQQTMIHQFY